MADLGTGTDYATIYKQLYNKYRTSPGVNPEDVEGARNSRDTGNLLNALFQSQALAGSVGGKPTPTASVDFSSFGNNQLKDLQQDAAKPQQNFEMGRQELSDRMAADKFKSDQDLSNVRTDSELQGLQQKSRMAPLDLEIKKAQAQKLRADALKEGMPSTPFDKDLATIQEIQKFRDTAKALSATDPDRARLLNEAADTRERTLMPPSDKMDPGQAQLAKDYANKYSDWQTSGRAKYQQNKAKLQDALGMLQNPHATDSGRWVGMLPDVARTQRAKYIEQQVRSAVQGMLIGTLGTQFTEKEGERVMKYAYDPTLPPEQNVAKIQSELQKLDSQAQSLESLGQRQTGGEGQEHSDAIEWAKANMNDPRAAKILMNAGVR